MKILVKCQIINVEKNVPEKSWEIEGAKGVTAAHDLYLCVQEGEMNAFHVRDFTKSLNYKVGEAVTVQAAIYSKKVDVK